MYLFYVYTLSPPPLLAMHIVLLLCLQPTDAGYLPAGQTPTRRAWHDIQPRSNPAQQAAARERQHSSAEGEEMQAAFSKRLSLTDLSFSTQGSGGERNVVITNLPKFGRNILESISAVH